MIHHAFDPDQNWKTRLEAEHVRLAMEDARHARNAKAAAFFAKVLAVVVAGVVFVSCVRAAIGAGLFSWVRF